LTAFGGAISGAYSDLANQINKYGSVVDKKSVLISAIEYAGVNLLSLIFSIYAAEITGASAVVGIYIFTLITNTISFAIDCLRALK